MRNREPRQNGPPGRRCPPQILYLKIQILEKKSWGEGDFPSFKIRFKSLSKKSISLHLVRISTDDASI